MNILVAPENCKKLIQVKLPQPKDGSLQLFFYDEDNLFLYESTKYYDQFRSWFLDNLFCKEGHFYMLTKIDPLFIFIPQLMKFANEKFRTLQDICATFASNDTTGSSRLDYALAPDIRWDQVCETKELDNELFVRFNEHKTLTWLSSKHNRTMEALKQQLDPKTSKATLISYATDLIDLYLPSSISDKFKTTVRSNSILTSDDARAVTSHNKKVATSNNKKAATSDHNNSKRPSTNITSFFRPK